MALLAKKAQVLKVFLGGHLCPGLVFKVVISDEINRELKGDPVVAQEKSSKSLTMWLTWKPN